MALYSHGLKLTTAFWIVAAIVLCAAVAFWGSIAYVAVHFITKWW